MNFDTLAEGSRLYCPCGNCVTKPGETALSALLYLAAKFEIHFKKKLFVTSGARCPAHNKAVGGTEDSAHTKGAAFDVAFSNSMEAFFIMNLLFEIGIKRIGYNPAKKFIHFDTDETRAQNVFFNY